MSTLLRERIPRLWNISKRIGCWTLLRYLALRYFIFPVRSCLKLKQQRYSLCFAEAKQPLQIRSSSSDLQVLGQIFVHREYFHLDRVDRDSVGLIIDCGANVGYSSAYLLSHFPGSRVVAIEPDPSNYEMLRLNLQPYGDRVTIVQAAVWSHVTKLALRDPDYRDGQEWARQVRTSEDPSVANVDAIDLPTIIREYGAGDKVSILKMDIEGAECVVLHNCSSLWLDAIQILVIELHDDTDFGDAHAIFHTEISTQDFELANHDELTFCFRTQDSSDSQ